MKFNEEKAISRSPVKYIGSIHNYIFPTMKKTIGIFLFILILSGITFTSISQNTNVKSENSTNYKRLSLDKGWRFYLGDIPFPEIKGHGISYTNAKAGRAWGAASPEFDDTDWRLLDLPHDWAVESPFDQNANLSQGYRQRGIAWYRRSFKVDTSERGKHFELQFDGVATHCKVWFNGTIVHRNWCGYTSFYIDITPMLNYGDEQNYIAIRVDADAQEGWWYEGAGIYRHTWLVKRSPVHIVTDGVYALPVRNSDDTWQLPAEVTIENSGKTTEDIEVEMSLMDNAGNTLVKSTSHSSINPLDRTVAALLLTVRNPDLWSVDNPVLYQLKTIIKKNNSIYDEVYTNCGFRSFRFTADSGFFFNDKPLKLKGVCNHQDAAGVGVAVPNSIWDFRLRKLKEMGANAYRCAHNPPSAEFLDACDRIGILVMDENRIFNSSPEYIRQLQWLIRRDRNHPSIILWSVFNEEPMQGSETGYEMVRRMRNEVRKLDKTRPVTAAMNGGLFSKINVSQAADVVGFNYQMNDYDRFHKANPTLAMTSSEDVSGLMVRGEYVTDTARHTLDSYDTQHPDWGSTHRKAWKEISSRPYLAGCFIWTGFDYRGEPTPYTWPTAGSNFGIMDQCGFPKSAFYLHQSQWVAVDDKPVLHLIPHWNWPADSVGKPIKVMAFSNAESVKLLLNGKLISEKRVDSYEMLTWYVPYKPGELEAIGYKEGREIARFKVETTGEAVGIELIPDRVSMDGDGWDAMPVTVRVVDAKGRQLPVANLPIQFDIKGSGRIIGLANGDPNSHEAEKGTKRSFFNGLAQLTLQTTENGKSPILLTATSPGLNSATLTIEVKPKNAVPSVAVLLQTLIIDKWKVSPKSVNRPDPTHIIPDNDMNSWTTVKAGELQDFTKSGYLVFRSTFKPYKGMQKNGAILELRDVSGKAEVWIDNELAATKASEEAATMIVKIAAGKNIRTINVLIESEKGRKAGLGGVVTVKQIE